MHEATTAGSERIGHNTSGGIAIGTSSRIEIIVAGYQHDWPWIRRLRLAAGGGRRYRLTIPDRGSREPHPRLANGPNAWASGVAKAGVTDAFAYAELGEILLGAGRTGAIGMSA